RSRQGKRVEKQARQRFRKLAKRHFTADLWFEEMEVCVRENMTGHHRPVTNIGTSVQDDTWSISLRMQQCDCIVGRREAVLGPKPHHTVTKCINQAPRHIPSDRSHAFYPRHDLGTRQAARPETSPRTLPSDRN